MVSKVSIVGIPIFLVGLVLLLLFTVIGLVIFPFGTTGARVDGNIIISPSTSQSVDIIEGGAEIGTHPLQVFVKANLIIMFTGDYSCRVSVIYSPSEPGAQTGFLRTGVSWNGNNPNNNEQRSITCTVPASYAGRRYSIYLEIENLGTSDITIGQRMIELRWSLYSTYLPILIVIIGLIVTILGFTVLKGGPAAPKRKKAVTPGGWEPTLQWGGGSSTSSGATTGKRPKMAIKSTKAVKSGQKKVVKKVVPKGGAQQSCKFCGKNVPASAFFCPSCYGKLR
jgi:hypothetical protein